MLSLSLGDGVEPTAESKMAMDDPMEVDTEGGELYNSKIAIPDAVS